MRRAKRSQDGKPVLRWLGRTAVLALVISGTVAFTQFKEAPAPDSQVLAAQTSADVRAERDFPSRSGNRTELVSVAAATVHLTVELDSGTLPVRTGSTTVAQVLTENHVVLDGGDVVSPGLTTRVHEDMVIRVRTPETSVETIRETVDFKSEEVPAPQIAKGTRVTQVEGLSGKTTVTYLVRSVDEEEIDRTQVAHVTNSVVRDEVVQVGTLDLPDATAKVLSPGEARTVARAMLTDRGWGDDQFTCLNNLWNRESNWRVQAQNPSSSAYGIPQSLPGTKMASAGADWRTNARTQISWGLGYIQGRYGTPCGAWAAFQAKGWY